MLQLLTLHGRRLGYAALGIAVLAAALYPVAIGSDITPQRAAGYLIFGLLAFSVALVVGYARLFNIGVGATFGTGAYTVAILTHHQVANPLLLFLVAVSAGVLISVLFGVYAIVASGIEYMMLTFLTTLAMFRVPNLMAKETGGDNGLVVKGGLKVSFGFNPLFGSKFYLLTLVVVGACILLCWYVLASQAGRAIRTIGRNPVRAAAMGYQVSQYRMALTLLSGFVAATAGWLYALEASFVSQDLLGLNNSLNGLVYALVGGVDQIFGPLVGALGYRYLSEKLSRISTQSGLYIGIALLLIVYFMPDGLIGLLRSLYRRVVLRRPPPAYEPGPLGSDDPGMAITTEEQRVL
ncbi:MAG: branched-chain amino acid ABC transporter permease [Dehalococcoidia bacterium]